MVLRYLTYLLIGITLLSCVNEVNYSNTRSNNVPEGFVQINDERFSLNNSVFFPKIMNYMILLREIGDSIVLSPTIEYDLPNQFEGETIDSISSRLDAHFKAISQMGFNSIRLLGFDVVKYSKLKGLEFNSYKGSERSTYNYKLNKQKYFSAVESFLNVAKKNKLKVMLLFPRPLLDKWQDDLRLEFIKEFLQHFSDNETVFAYDFMNEPLYFDNMEFEDHSKRVRDKVDAYRLVSSWKTLMGTYAPNQLMTISYAEPSEVFEWDPSILPVDFVSIHSYHPLRVPNEIYWFSKFAKRPWVISETSLPAENDSISYEEQAIFMQEIFQRAVNCGAAGVGWWQYQDVHWGPFEHNFSAIVNSKGTSILEDGESFIYGTIKDAGRLLPKLKLEKKGDCNCHTNYYNMMGYHNYVIKGKILSEGNPVEGAVIRAWNQYWDIALNTFTNENGEYTIYSNDKCAHFEISAPGLSQTKFSKIVDYNLANFNENDVLKDVDLEYHSIHFRNYLKNKDSLNSVIQFDPQLFNKFIYEAEFEPIELIKLDIKH